MIISLGSDEMTGYVDANREISYTIVTAVSCSVGALFVLMMIVLMIVGVYKVVKMIRTIKR